MYIWHAMFGEALKLPRRQQAWVEISGGQVGELCSLGFRGLVVLHEATVLMLLLRGFLSST